MSADNRNDLKDTRSDIYQEMLEAYPDPAVILQDEKHKLINRAFTEKFGYTQEDVNRGMYFLDLIQERNAGEVEKRYKDGLQGKEIPIRYRTELTGKTGQRVFVETTAAVIPFNGRPAHLVVIRDISEKIESEKALEDSEINYRSIFDSANDAIFIHNLYTGEIVDVNEKMCEMFGVTKEEARNLTVQDISAGVSPFRQEEAVRLINKVIVEGPQIFEWQSKTKSGKLFWVEVNLKKVFLQGEDRVLAIVRDISQRKASTEAIAEKERRLASILKASPIGIGLVSDRTFLWVNDKMCQMTRYSPSELVGKSARILYPSQEEFDRVGKEKYEQIRRNGTGVVEAKWERKDGTIIDVLLSSTPIDSRDLSQGVTFTVMDITEEKKAVEQLAVFQKFAETSSLGHGFSDLKGNIFYFNPKLCELLEVRDPADYLGKNIQDFYPPDSQEQLLQEILPSVQKDGSWQGEVFLMSQRGKKTPTMQNVSLILDDKGNPRYFGNAIADITERKKAEKELQQYQHHLEKLVEQRTQQLIHSERLAATGRLAASVSHEINNPLQGILTHCEIIKDGLPSNFSEAKSLEIVEENLKKIKDIIKQLLDIYRPTSNKKEAVDLRDAVEKTFLLLRNQLKKKKIQLNLMLEESLPDIQGVRQQIQQVVLNLLLNAIDAAQEGGEITVRSARKGSDVHLSVQDAGCGIKKDELDRIFDPFFSTKKNSGVGLGLFVSEGLIRNHNGHIQVESEEGKGSVFTIVLPCS